MPIADTWLMTFANSSSGPLRITADLDDQYGRRALAARSSPSERDALFIDLSATIARWVWPYRGWQLDPWELDDVLQESYLAFIDTLEFWSGRVRVAPSGALDPDFGRYFLRTYPLRLRDRVDALLDTTNTHRSSDPIPPGYDETPDPWVPESDVRARVLIDAICARLPPRDALTLRLAAASGYALRSVARQTGENPRTLYHRWARIIETARDVVLGQDDAAA